MHDLDRLFNPKSVAVVGASPKEGSFGGNVLENLRSSGFSGTVVGVNPRYDRVSDIPCYSSLESVGSEIDCAVIVVPGPAAVAAAEEAAQSGVGGVIVLASGFGEVGGVEGAALQDRLGAVATTTGTPILGPNCLGLANFGTGAVLTFVPGFGRLATEVSAKDGGMAVISQSGALGMFALQAETRGVPFSYFVSTGNSAVVDVGDCVRHLVTRDGVSSILLTYEGLRPGTDLLASLEAAADRGIPVVAVKAGQSAAGISAAVSHTGVAVGDYRACKAALESRGVLVLDSIAEAVQSAAFLGKLRGFVPSAPGIGVVTGSGGAGVLVCDAAARHATPVASFSPGTKDSLVEQLPGFAAAGNPVDVTGSALGAGDPFGSVMRTVGADENVGCVVVPLGFALYDESGQRRRESVLSAGAAIDKPVAVVWMSEWFDHAAAAPFESSSSVGLFRDMDLCLRVLRHWTLRSAPPTVSEPPEVEVPEALRLSTGVLDEDASRTILTTLGVPFSNAVVVRANELNALRDALRTWKTYPAVLKAVLRDVPHKFKAGGVKLDLHNETAVLDAASEMLADLSARGLGGKVEGFMVQEMVRGTQEVLVGCVRDEIYGPIVAVGPGGTGASGSQPVGVIAAPFTVEAAQSLLGSVPGVSHLSSAVQTEVATIMAAVGSLVSCTDLVKEIDINPLVVSSVAGGVVAVDALISMVQE